MKQKLTPLQKEYQKAVKALQKSLDKALEYEQPKHSVIKHIEIPKRATRKNLALIKQQHKIVKSFNLSQSAKKTWERKRKEPEKPKEPKTPETPETPKTPETPEEPETDFPSTDEPSDDKTELIRNLKDILNSGENENVCNYLINLLEVELISNPEQLFERLINAGDDYVIDLANIIARYNRPDDLFDNSCKFALLITGNQSHNKSIERLVWEDFKPLKKRKYRKIE